MIDDKLTDIHVVVLVLLYSLLIVRVQGELIGWKSEPISMQLEILSIRMTSQTRLISLAFDERGTATGTRYIYKNVS
jgi:hypothetical protein